MPRRFWMKGILYDCYFHFVWIYSKVLVKGVKGIWTTSMGIEIFPTSAFIFPVLTLYSKVNRRISSMGDFFFNYTEKILHSILCNSNLFTTFAIFQAIGIVGMTFIIKRCYWDYLLRLNFATLILEWRW